MGVTIQKTVGAGATEVPDGLALLRFDGLRIVSHPEWAETAEQNKFHKADSGDRIHFDVTVLDSEDGAVQYDEDGDPKEIETLTTVSFGEKSTAYKLLKGIFTKEELNVFDDPDQSIDSDVLVGRVIQGIIAHNKGGYPFVESTMPATKAQIALASKAAA